MNRVKTRAEKQPQMAGDKAADISQEDEVLISYLRSRTGKTRSIPVWFTVSEKKMELLPMYGTRTKWFEDVQKSGRLDVRIRDWQMGANPSVVKDVQAIERTKRRFVEKYGESDVRRYYPTQDVALVFPL